MMRLPKSIATVLTAVAFALAFAGGATAQANSAAHDQAQEKAATKGVPTASVKPSSAAPKSKTAPKSLPAAKPSLAKATPAKPSATKLTPAKPSATKVTAAKPLGTKSTAKPAPRKEIAAKPAPAKTVAAKPNAPKPEAKTGKPAGMNPGPVEAPAASPEEALVAKRDPFVSLVNDRKDGGGGPALPAGKAGLVVATVQVDGTVKSGDDLIAVVSNPERHVYFIREGDQLYDGSVKKIDLNGVTFQEDSRDAFGKPVVREVTKRIYASAGEQQ